MFTKELIKSLKSRTLHTMSHGKAIAKNAIWLMAATTAQKVIAFLTFTLVARLGGVETMGKFFYAVSITSVFVILSDLGLTPVVIREMAASKERGRIIFAKALRAKLLLIPIAILASLGYALVTGANKEIFVAVSFACFVMSADAISLLWYGALRGRRQLRFEALGMFTAQCITAIVSILSITILHWGVWGLVFGLFCGSAWNVIWSILQARRMGIRDQVSSIKYQAPYRELIQFALPFALAGFFVKIYSYVDTLLLKHFHDAVAVGYYAVAYKITYAFQFLPLTFVAALYPGMSAAHASKEKKALQTMLTGSLRLMIVISVPIVAALSAFAPRFVPLVYGKPFYGSIAPLTILAWVLIPIFLDFPIGSLLNATHRATKKTLAMGVTMMVNVLLNIILVPALGPVGASLAGLGSFWVLFFVGVWFARRDFDRLSTPFLFLLKGVFIAIVLWLFTRLVLIHLSLLIALILFGLGAIILLWVTRLIGSDDLRLFRRWIQPASPATVEASVHEEN